MLKKVYVVADSIKSFEEAKEMDSIKCYDLEFDFEMTESLSKPKNPKLLNIWASSIIDVEMDRVEISDIVAIDFNNQDQFGTAVIYGFALGKCLAKGISRDSSIVLLGNSECGLTKDFGAHKVLTDLDVSSIHIGDLPKRSLFHWLFRRDEMVCNNSVEFLEMLGDGLEPDTSVPITLNSYDSFYTNVLIGVLYYLGWNLTIRSTKPSLFLSKLGKLELIQG